MTLPSDSEVQRQSKQALDADLAKLSQQQRNDIADARLRALRMAAQRRTDAKSASLRWPWLGAPVALALVAAVLVSYPTTNRLPPMPLELASANMPAEELALLEDLEFVDWLAAQPLNMGNEYDTAVQ